MITISTTPDELRANQTHYFRIASGSWRGYFFLYVHDWRAFWHSRLGVKNRILALGIIAIQKTLGNSTLLFKSFPFPDWGTYGVSINDLCIKKYGVVLYSLKEQHVLHLDGSNVFVHSRERLGPLPLLFTSCKKYPGRVAYNGLEAEYTDVPLLGKKWQGKCQILNDNNIEAKLECEWGSARQVITRLGNNVTPNFSASKGNFARLETLDDVHSRLCMYRDWYETVRDPRAIFTHAYATITEMFAKSMRAVEFDNVSWIIALDIAFAEEYFTALDAYDLGTAVPKAWDHVFTQISDYRTSVLEELILSMSAHIIHDLPFALTKARQTETSRSEIFDFDLANDVLERGINSIQQIVGRRYNPPLIWLDRIAAEDDEIITNYGIRLARAAAWFNSERLLDQKSNSDTKAALVKSVDVLLRLFLRPNLVSVRILQRILRLASRLTRRWPKSRSYSDSRKAP